MLTSLSIRNYALISYLEIDFHSGFSVLTGETGAGKSIILGALSLILGQRADSKSIKQGANKCTIEGCFNISSYNIESFFSEKEWEYDAQHCIIRREIYDNGKSRAFINDVPVTLSDLKELVSILIDVHSQHQNLLLGDNHFQMQVVDALTNQPELFQKYKKLYTSYIAVKKDLNLLIDNAQKSREEEEYIRFQVQQLKEVNLVEGEQGSLEQEIQVLSHVEEIKSGLFHLYRILSDEEHGVVVQLKNSLNITQSLQKLNSSSDIQERLHTAYIDIKELAREISGKEDALEHDPEKLQILNDRLNTLLSLQQKHRVNTVEELLEIQRSMEEKLAVIDSFDEQIAVLQKQSDEIYKQVCILAEQLSQIRQQAAKDLEQQLIEKVSVLGMPNMCFSCNIKQKINPDNSGINDITFLFSANKNIQLQPVAEIASGGEISRLMLGIKALIAGSMALPTIIFDEIDTGVSGEIADKMGDIMKELGGIMQVITITHLPQIAAKGNYHYHVYKNDVQETTETHICKLKQEERVKEIAQMLSGSKLSDAAIANAKELLKYSK